MSTDNIELTLPVNAAYISAARLTASSVANRLGFAIEEIEDIKTAVSEACTFIIAKTNSKNPFKLMFKPQKNCVSITFNVKGIFNPNIMKNETSILMIKALMDDIKVNEENDNFIITLTKNHNVISFD